MKLKDMSDTDFKLLVKDSVESAFKEFLEDQSLGAFMADAENDEEVSYEEAKSENLLAA